ncbi:UspA [Phaffia rhodozyma]|uniref:UspA n=1 Tax=Phaffia rhodozyma TaxID=264483 RepID=A0A0F7ST98_PHARH|nr:UspA [Phaffia rhodozyma]
MSSPPSDLVEHYHPDISSRSPHNSPSKYDMANAFELTSPLTRQKTPEEIATPTRFVDPKQPTYGKTLSSPLDSPGILADQIQEFDLPGQSKSGEDEGMKIVLGYDTTVDALLAFNHVLNRMSLHPNDHVYMAQVLPLTSASASSSLFSSPQSTPNTHTAQAVSYEGAHGDEDDTNLSTLSSKDRELVILRRIRKATMEKLTTEGIKLLSKGCKVTPVIVHSEQPAKALCTLAERHDADLIVIGRRKLSKLHRVVGAGSVGNYCLLHGGCNVLIVQK